MARGRSYDYKPPSYEDTVDRAERKGSAFDTLFRDQKLFRPRQGGNLIRILPPGWQNARHYGFPIKVHRNIGPDDRQYLCLRENEHSPYKPCPICQALYDLGSRATAEDKKELRPGTNIAYYIIDRDNEKEGVQIWMASSTTDSEIAAQSVNRRTKAVLDIVHPDHGYDIEFTRSGTTRNNTRYRGFQIMREESPLSESARRTDEWLDHVFDKPLPDTLNFYQPKYLEEVFYGRSKEEEDRDTKSRRLRDGDGDDRDRDRDDDRDVTRRGRDRDDDPDERSSRRGRDDEPEERPSRRDRDRDEDRDERPSRSRERDRDDDRDERPRRGRDDELEERSSRRGRDDEPEDRPSRSRRDRDDDPPEDERPRRGRDRGNEADDRDSRTESTRSSRRDRDPEPEPDERPARRQRTRLEEDLDDQVPSEGGRRARPNGRDTEEEERPSSRRREREEREPEEERGSSRRGREREEEPEERPSSRRRNRGDDGGGDDEPTEGRRNRLRSRLDRGADA